MTKVVKNSEIIHRSTYTVEYSDEEIRREFTELEKALLRPIAETLAILDGNAFFSSCSNDGKEWYEMYLNDAWQAAKSVDGDEVSSVVHNASWAKGINDPEVRSAWENYIILANLKKEKNGNT